MAQILETIEVDAPVDVVFEQWTRFDDFPAFMRTLREVRSLGGRRREWRAEVDGERIAWITRETRHESERCIAWCSALDEVSVSFAEFGGQKTRVTLEIDYVDTVESVGPTRRFASAPSAGDLLRFKELFDARERVKARRGECRSVLAEVDVFLELLEEEAA